MFWILRFLQSHSCMGIGLLRLLGCTHLHTAHVMLHPRHVVLLRGMLWLCILLRLALCFLLLMRLVRLWTARHHHPLHALGRIVWFRGGAGTLSICSHAESARNRKCDSHDL